MILSTGFALAAVLCAGNAQAGAISKPAAAAYTITNLASGNHIIANSISATGEVAYAASYPTGGKGLTVNATVDGLVSQDSVHVAGDYVYAVNAGSNTISAFRISPSNPTSLKLVGQPTYSHGEFPNSITSNPLNPYHICAVNNGKVNSVACFYLTAEGLEVIPSSVKSLGLTQTTPPVGANPNSGDLIFSEDGKFLRVGVKGSMAAPGYIAEWTVEWNGSLSSSYKKYPATGGGAPFSLTSITGHNAVLASDPTVGGGVYNFDVSPTSVKAQWSQAIVIPGEGAACWSTMSKATGSYFITDAAGVWNEISIDSNLTPTLIHQYTIPTGGALDTTRATISGKDYIYTIAVGGSSPMIEVLAVGTKPASGTVHQSYDLGTELTKAKIPYTTGYFQGMAIYVVSKY